MPKPPGTRAMDEELTMAPMTPIPKPTEPRRSDGEVLQEYLRDDSAGNRPSKPSHAVRDKESKPPMPSGRVVVILIGIGAGIGLVLAVLMAVAADDKPPAGVFIFLPLFLAGILVGMGGVWRVHEKAGYHGATAIIPIYNVLVLHDIAGLSPWWLVAWFVPCVNYVAIFMLYYGVARNFGRGVLFALGLFFFGFVFFPLLGFGSDEYRGDYEF